MYTLKYIFLVTFLLNIYTIPLLAQNLGAKDETDIYWGETTERKNIEASDLPTDVLKAFETSEYSDMDMLSVQKIKGKPMKKSQDPYRPAPEDSIMDGEEVEDMDMLDSAYADRPYRMREENRDIAETYYQDTYDNTESLSDTLIVEDAFKDETNTYYEIEVDGDVASYRILFNEKGEIRHTELMEM